MSAGHEGTRLFPKSRRDRVGALVGAICLVIAVRLVFKADDLFGYTLLVVNLMVGALHLVLAYFVQDREVGGGESEYKRAIGELDSTRNALEKLAVFLESKRKRVEETEQTLKRLQAEKTALEPLVSTQRETVEAILAAHSQTLRRGLWKDRAFGFGLGVLSSLAAGAILYWLEVGA